MRHAMWMGTRGFEMWVPTPKISPGYNRPGWSSSTPLLNGGVTIRSSKGAHNQYVFEWNNGAWDDLMPIRDMADGVYDTVAGVNPVYFLDPTAAARNLLPQAWATPHLASEDALPLLRGQRPSVVAQAASAFRLPARAAVYATQASPNPRRVYVPVPPGYTANFGWIGSGSGQVGLYPATATGVGSPVLPAPLDPAGGVWTNATVDGGNGTTGVEVGILGTGAVTVRAMLLQVLPTGRVPRAGVPWSAGMGHSGCQFTDHAGLVPLSVPLNLVGASATLEETGAWL